MMDEIKYGTKSEKDFKSENGFDISSPTNFTQNGIIEKKSNLDSEEEKKFAEQKIWEDLMGDDTPWKDMTTKQKTIRACLNTCKIVMVFCLLYFFICSLGMLSSAFRLISGKSTGNIMGNGYVSSPIVGLMIGILVTVLVQSSSTSTSIIVSMVAASIISVEDAIPMVMGANIGTSVTNTIVSLTQVADREQFRRAFSGATVHDMFNWLAVLVLLPIEILTGMLYKLTTLVVDSLTGGSGAEVQLLTVLTDPFTNLIIQLDGKVLTCWGINQMLWKDSMIKEFCSFDDITTFAPATTMEPVTTMEPWTSTYPESSTHTISSECQNSTTHVGIPNSCKFLFYETSMTDSTVGIILLIISLTILCTSLIFIVKILNSLLKGSIAKVIQKVINADIPYVPWLTGYIAITIGAILTFIVQSSSVFTSTLTPLIGLGIISVQRAYPLTLGSNIGTTTTALLAAMATTGNRRDSIQIALVHFFFNVIAICIYYPIPFMRWPIPLCMRLGNITAKYRWFAIIYLIVMFFLLPGTIFALSLGGTAVLWGVVGPLLFILLVVIIINLLQTHKPQFLPEILRNWNWLPLPLHSFKPYDRAFTSLPCCTKCKDASIEENEVTEVIIDSKPVREKEGIENPMKVSDSFSNS